MVQSGVRGRWSWDRRWVRPGLVAVGLAASSHVASAQLKAGLVEDPKVGEDAPDFTLSYLTAQGPGPADQPFRLRAELGHTVVLVFATSSDSAAMRREWQAFAGLKPSLEKPGLVVVGLVRWKSEPTQALASELSLPMKFLPDSVGRGFRNFGVVGRGSGARWAAFVVDAEGRVKYRSKTFLPSDSAEVAQLVEKVN